MKPLTHEERELLLQQAGWWDEIAAAFQRKRMAEYDEVTSSGLCSAASCVAQGMKYASCGRVPSMNFQLFESQPPGTADGWWWPLHATQWALLRAEHARKLAARCRTLAAGGA